MKIKVMSFTKWEVFFALSVFTIPFSTALTNMRDVSAINNLYMSLASPPLPGWVAFGGDPCGEGWHGVVCDSSSITEIRIRGMNVGGSLSDSIADFSSIQVMDFSNNQIGGTIPQALPFTIQNFTLSGNQFIGTIPFTLSFLSGLSELSFGNNQLSGEVPDYFQQLTQLTRLDLSSNNLTGELPPSMKDLSSLMTLHLQNNKLIGTIDVLEDLPLTDLNVQNTLFSGPIPPKLLTVPNFKKDGTPFNTSVITPPPPGAVSPLSSASPPLIWSPPSDEVGEPSRSGSGQPTFEMSPPSGSGKFWTAQRIIVAVALVAIIALVLGLFVTLWKCYKSEKDDLYDSESHNDQQTDFNESPKIEKVSREPVVKPFDGYGAGSRKDGFSVPPRGEKTQVAMPDMPRKPLPQPPIRFQSQDPAKGAAHFPPGLKSSSSATVFTIASLQQYTNSFSEENVIGEGSLGNVYRAQLPQGKLLAVKKLSNAINRTQSDGQFLNLVSDILKLKHGNVLELIGYCNEFDQRLLVYEYSPNGSLQDALHLNSEIHKKLTWSVRMNVALGASRALQFLHEACQPPVVHQNFKSSKVLLDERLAVRVVDCGLAHLLPPRSTNQIGGYAAPEVELGSYTCQSDVYSLGVVMLELLTGRRPFDRTRPRGQQTLAQWAIPRLHDIDELTRMVDPSLHGAYPMKSLSRFADIISRSLQMEPGFRPPISEIVQDLEHLM